MTLDGTLKFDAGALTQLRFGLARDLAPKSRDDYDNDWTGGSSQYDFYTTPTGANPITFGSLGANVISTTNFPNYMQGAGGKFPTTVAVFNIPNLLNALATLNGQPNLYDRRRTELRLRPALPQFNAVNSYDVKEITSAAYLEATFAGEQLGRQLGMRVVHTSTTAQRRSMRSRPSPSPIPPIRPTRPSSLTATPTPTTSKCSYTSRCRR